MDGQWTTTVQGDRFLLGEDGDGADKKIAFASNSALHGLANADTYHMDGTFATTLRLFYQIVTLHAFILGVMLPLVFGLKSLNQSDSPSAPNVSCRISIKVCHFHFQCLWRRIQGKGLSVNYGENAEHRNWFCMLLAMPFVPVPHVKYVFQFSRTQHQMHPVYETSMTTSTGHG